LHFDKDIGRNKVDSAYDKLRAFNPTLEYVPINYTLTAENAGKYIPDYDVIILAVDSITSRFIINDACCKYTKPMVNGGVNGMLGMLNLVIPGKTPCLRCLYDEQTETSKATSFAPVVSAVSALEAQLALLVLLDKPPLPFDRIMLFSGEDMTWHRQNIEHDPNCPACGHYYL